MSGDGTRFVTRGTATQQRERHGGDRQLGDRRRATRLPHDGDPIEEALRRAAEAQAEDVLDLQSGDDRCDPRGEAGGHRVRDEFDELAETTKPHHDQDEAAHHAGKQQPGHPEAGIDRGQDDDEGRRGSRHLQPRASQRGHHHAGDDRRVEPVLRRHPDRDRERHRQGKRDDPDHQARQHVGPQIGARVPLAPDRPHRPGGEIPQLDAVERRSIPGASHRPQFITSGPTRRRESRRAVRTVSNVRLRVQLGTGAGYLASRDQRLSNLSRRAALVAP